METVTVIIPFPDNDLLVTVVGVFFLIAVVRGVIRLFDILPGV